MRTTVIMLGALLAFRAMPVGAISAVPGDTVLIEFGDRSVTVSEFDSRFEIAVRLLALQQGVNLAEQDPAVVETLRQQFLQKYATDLVLLEEARRQQLRVSDAQVDTALGELFEDDAAYDRLLAEAPLAKAEAAALVERVVRDEQTVELMTEHLLREIKVPPGDVITMHHDAKHLLATPEAVCLRHIQLADARSAIELLGQLQDGADFAALAAEHSTDLASAAGGGDLGCFERGAAGPRTEFERAAFAAGEGEVTGPIESRFGHHLLLVYEHRMPREPTLNEAYAQIERELALEQLPQRIEALVEQSGIRLYPDRYQ